MDLTSTEIIYAVFAVLIAIIFIQFIWMKKIGSRISKLTAGNDGKSLEQVIHSIQDDLAFIKNDQGKRDKRIEQLDNQMERVIRGVGVIRFNPFKGNGGGGDQSFAVALLKKTGDGVVFSSIYSRERVSVYSKPIHNLTSTYELSDEEKQAVKQAQESF